MTDCSYDEINELPIEAKVAYSIVRSMVSNGMMQITTTSDKYGTSITARLDPERLKQGMYEINTILCSV